MSISVSLNNQTVELESNLNLSEALQHWGYQSHDIAVAINQEFVPRSEYLQTRLQAKDQVDVIAPVQGG